LQDIYVHTVALNTLLYKPDESNTNISK